MDELSVLSIDEESSQLDLVDAVFQYITESRYPVKMSSNKEESHQEESSHVYCQRWSHVFQKKKKERVSVQNTYDRILDYHS